MIPLLLITLEAVALKNGRIGSIVNEKVFVALPPASVNKSRGPRKT